MSKNSAADSLIRGKKPIEVLCVSKTVDTKSMVQSLISKATNPKKIYVIALYEI